MVHNIIVIWFNIHMKNLHYLASIILNTVMEININGENVFSSNFTKT